MQAKTLRTCSCSLPVQAATAQAWAREGEAEGEAEATGVENLRHDRRSSAATLDDGTLPGKGGAGHGCPRRRRGSGRCVGRGMCSVGATRVGAACDT